MTEIERLQMENDRLRTDNARLHAENERLRGGKPESAENQDEHEHAVLAGRRGARPMKLTDDQMAEIDRSRTGDRESASDDAGG